MVGNNRRRQDKRARKGENRMTFTKAQKIFIGIAIVVLIGVSVSGCSQPTGKYTGPVDKLTLAAYAGDTGALAM